MTLKDYAYKFRQFYKRECSLLLYYVLRKKQNEQRLVDLKGSLSGRRAFIVCNGPSLRAEDLNKIHESGDLSFASNKIDKIFSQTFWRPSFYMVMDEAYQYSLLEVMKSIPAKTHFYRTDSFITTRKLKGRDCVFLHTYGGEDLLDSCKFSDDCSRVVYTVATVTYAIIQVAVYMGIHELYIIGCDNSYGRERTRDGKVVENNVSSYFPGSDSKDTNNIIATTWQMNIAYECARKYADDHGIVIKNATRGGHLEAFERVSFDSLF